jgi:hypothetical protein
LSTLPFINGEKVKFPNKQITDIYSKYKPSREQSTFKTSFAKLPLEQTSDDQNRNRDMQQ